MSRLLGMYQRAIIDPISIILVKQYVFLIHLNIIPLLPMYFFQPVQSPTTSPSPGSATKDKYADRFIPRRSGACWHINFNLTEVFMHFVFIQDAMYLY